MIEPQWIQCLFKEYRVAAWCRNAIEIDFEKSGILPNSNFARYQLELPVLLISSSQFWSCNFSFSVPIIASCADQMTCFEILFFFFCLSVDVIWRCSVYHNTADLGHMRRVTAKQADDFAVAQGIPAWVAIGEESHSYRRTRNLQAAHVHYLSRKTLFCDCYMHNAELSPCQLNCWTDRK